MLLQQFGSNERQVHAGFGITNSESKRKRVCVVVVKGAGGGCYGDKISKEFVGNAAARNGGGSLVFEELDDKKLSTYSLRGLLPNSRATPLQICNQFVC